MCDTQATYKHVPREVFNKLSDRLFESNLYLNVTVYYNGTNLYGDLTIEGKSSKEYKEALRIFNDEYL